MKLILQIAVGIALGAILLSIVCGTCVGFLGSKSTRPAVDADKYIKTTIVRSEQMGTYIRVQVKAENISGAHISSVAASVVLIDNNGKEIAVDSGHLVYATDGGLGPGASTYRDFMFDNISLARVKGTVVNVTGIDL